MQRMNKQERELRSEAILQAAKAALLGHFTGDDAGPRRLRFLWDGMRSSVVWIVKLVLLVSWAVMGALLVGPDHDWALTQVHGWMVATPIDQVLVTAHGIVLTALVVFLKGGLLLGFGQELFAIVQPAMAQAKQQFAMA